MKRALRNTKDTLTVACFVYTCVQAARGWYGLGKDAKEALQERHNRTKMELV